MAFDRTIAITGFICFDDAIPAIGSTIVVVIIIAATRAAPVSIFTNVNAGENADRAAIACASAYKVRCTCEAVIASGRAISIAAFSCFDDIIGTEWSTIIIVETIAARGATTIRGSAGGNYGIRTVCVACGCRSEQGIDGTRVLVVAAGRTISIANFSGFK